MQKLKQWFLIWLLILIAGLVLYAIFGPQGKRLDWSKIDYSMNSSSQLYFKNMRSYFYEQEVFEEGNYILHRIKSRNTDSVLNKLSIVIVQNVIQDAAFIRLESGMLDLDEEKMILTWQQEKREGKLVLENSTNEAHYTFAAQLYNLLEANAKLWLILDGQKMELSEKEKKSLRKSLGDYFKLVGKVY
tara:strand:+ start:1754 stop:2317 length:564 start_codon:yes stop_codon:yes gene_type:complete